MGELIVLFSLGFEIIGSSKYMYMLHICLNVFECKNINKYKYYFMAWNEINRMAMNC